MEQISAATRSSSLVLVSSETSDENAGIEQQRQKDGVCPVVVAHREHVIRQQAGRQYRVIAGQWQQHQKKPDAKAHRKPRHQAFAIGGGPVGGGDNTGQELQGAGEGDQSELGQGLGAADAHKKTVAAQDQDADEQSPQPFELDIDILLPVDVQQLVWAGSGG